jgi:hypothetical protein
MSYEQRDNSGVLFENDRKEKDTHPDHKGKAMIGGKMYWVSLWIKEGRNGDFFSLAFKPQDEQRQTPARGGGQQTRAFGGGQRSGGRRSELDDDIPF